MYFKQLCKAWQLGIGKTIFATLAANGNSISVGLCQGYSAVLLPQLTEPNSTIEVTQDEASWIASLGVISNPLGALLAGVLMEMLGRKTTIKLATLPYLIGWIIIAFSDSIVKLYVGRFIAGLAVGMATASYVYVAEIAPCVHRGILSAMGPIHVSLGVLFVYILGFILHWQYVAAVCTLCSVFSYLAMSAVPESPAWLVTHNRIPQAKEALMWLRSNPNQVDQEFKELSEIVSNKLTNSDGKLPNKNDQLSKFSKRCRGFFSPSIWKPFLILVLLFAFQEGSGIYIILYYAVTLFQEVGTGLNEYIASIIVAFMRLVMSIVGAMLIKNFERRTLVMISGTGMAVAMGMSGTYEHLYADISHSERPFAWIPLFCVLLHVCVSMVGFLQIPWMMTGELFPLKVRGIMGGVVSSLAYLLIFASVKTFPDLLAVLGMDGTLWLFCIAGFTGAIYCALFLPETNGKTLREIELYFNKSEEGSYYDVSKNNMPTKIFTTGLDFTALENGLKSKTDQVINNVSQTAQCQSVILQRTLDVDNLR